MNTQQIFKNIKRQIREDHQAFLKEIEIPIEEGLINHNQIDIHNDLHITGSIFLFSNYKPATVKELHQYLSHKYASARFIVAPGSDNNDSTIHYTFTNDLFTD